MQTIKVNYNGNAMKIKGQVYHYGKKGYAKKSTIQEYNRIESSENNISHQSNDGNIYWLKNFGLDSWCVNTGK